MKNSMRIMVACALLVSAFGAPAVFACTNTWTETVTETLYNYVGNDCWWGGPSDSGRLVIYYQREETTNINLFQVTQNYCTGYTDRQFLYTVYSYVSRSCWQKTNTSCVGSQDWQPSPLC